jgi:hypothetical protein
VTDTDVDAVIRDLQRQFKSCKDMSEKVVTYAANLEAITEVKMDGRIEVNAAGKMEAITAPDVTYVLPRIYFYFLFTLLR